MYRRKANLYLLLAFFLSAVLGFSACSKKGEDGVAPEDRAILQKLPANTVGFLSFNYESDSFKRYQHTPWSSGLDSLVQAATTSNSAVVSALRNSGLLQNKPGDAAVLKDGVAFVTIQTPGVPQFGLYFRGNGKEDLSTRLGLLKDSLKQEGLRIEEEVSDGLSGFSVALTSLPVPPIAVQPIEPTGIPTNLTLHCFSDGRDLSAASSAQLAKSLLATSDGAGMSTLKNSPRFTRVFSAVPRSSDQFVWGYVDLITAGQWISNSGASAAVAAQAQEIPIESVAFSRGMGESIGDVLAVSLSSRNDRQQKIITSLANSGSTSLAEQMPPDVALLLNFDGAALSRAREVASEEAPAEDRDAVTKSLTLLDSIKRLAIGLRGSSGASPFPELLIVADSTDPAELQNALKEELTGALQSSGMPLSGWQEKDVGGIKTSFVMSPLGIGLYLSSVRNSVVLTSSEKATADYVKASGGGKDTLRTVLSSSAQALAHTSPSLVLAYGNFERVAGALQTMQGTLGMFTGGKTLLNNTQLQAMRELGSVVVAAQFEDGLLKVRTAYDLPKGSAG